MYRYNFSEDVDPLYAIQGSTDVRYLTETRKYYKETDGEKI